MDLGWIIIGLSGVLGFVAHFVARAIKPCKPCVASPISQINLGDDKDDRAGDLYEGWSMFHEETIFKKGIRRIIHVNRPAIAANMKHRETYPTCVVIDGNGVKHQFHHVVFCGASALEFDRNYKAANVYLSTYAEIRGYIVKDQKSKFEQTEKPKKEFWKDRVRPIIAATPLAGCLLED